MATLSQRILKDKIDTKTRELQTARKNVGNNPQRKVHVKKLEKQLATLVSKRTSMVPKVKGSIKNKRRTSKVVSPSTRKAMAKSRKPKNPLAVDIQGEGAKPTSKVREQQKAEARKKATAAYRKKYLAKQKEKARLSKIKTPRKKEISDLELVPGKTKRKLSPRKTRTQKRQLATNIATTPRPPGRIPTADEFRITPDMDAPRGGPKIKKKRKTTAERILEAPGKIAASGVGGTVDAIRKAITELGGGISPSMIRKHPDMDAPGGGPKIKKEDTFISDIIKKLKKEKQELKSKPTAQLMDAPGGGKKRTARKVKKVVKKRTPSDFERYGLTDKPIKRAKDIRITPTKKKASVDTTADFTDEYEKDKDFFPSEFVTSGSGDVVTDSSGSPVTLGKFKISTDSDDYDVGHKRGGKVGRGKKKSKGRKRAALRGYRAELRGG